MQLQKLNIHGSRYFASFSYKVLKILQENFSKAWFQLKFFYEVTWIDFNENCFFFLITDISASYSYLKSPFWCKLAPANRYTQYPISIEKKSNLFGWITLQQYSELFCSFFKSHFRSDCRKVMWKRASPLSMLKSIKTFDIWGFGWKVSFVKIRCSQFCLSFS